MPLISIGNIIEINPKIKPITNNDKTKGELNKEKLLLKKKKKKKITTTINWNNPIYKKNLQLGNYKPSPIKHKQNRELVQTQATSFNNPKSSTKKKINTNPPTNQ